MLTGKLARSRELTASHEHYLRAIAECQSRLGHARLTDVARALDVAPPTLSEGLKPLIARGLIEHEERRFLVLTPAGERLAREVRHRFAVIHAFLHDVLGVSGAEADRDACRLEHDLSASTTDRLLDLIRLLREDDEVRAILTARLAGYRRPCGAALECSTCGLACLESSTVAPR